MILSRDFGQTARSFLGHGLNYVTILMLPKKNSYLSPYLPVAYFDFYHKIYSRLEWRPL